ncbi:MAG: ribosome maturation factor RimP [Clostridia bacterium]|nr:ribosome maturation factor RimP [Clostridia bacterium]
MSKIAEKVEEFITPMVDELEGNIEIVEVEFAKKYNGDNLTIFIDKPGGVTIEDCELVHNLVDGPLDELDPTEGKPYTLNVSSPGIDRPIVTDKDYARNVGLELEIKLFEPINKKKILVGTLVAFNNDSIIVEINGENLEIERKKISKATKFINF